MLGSHRHLPCKNFTRRHFERVGRRTSGAAPLFLAVAAWPAWLHTCLINDRPELLRLVFGMLSLLLEELFLRSLQRISLIVSLSSLPVNRNGTW